MHIETKDGKAGYEVTTAQDALKCVTIIETHAEEGAWKNHNYILAANGLDRWLKRLIEGER